MRAISVGDDGSSLVHGGDNGRKQSRWARTYVSRLVISFYVHQRGRVLRSKLAAAAAAPLRGALRSCANIVVAIDRDVADPRECVVARLLKYLEVAHLQA